MERRSGTNRKENMLKVIMIGETGIGKSCITKRYVEKKYDDQSFVTIGANFTIKEMDWNSNTVVKLQIWNLAGHESYMKMNRIHYKGSKGAIVVLDLTNDSTLNAAAEWKKDLDCNYSPESGRPLPAVLLANKCDLKERCVVSVSSLDAFCKDNGFLAWFETSAKENINIDEAFAFLVKEMMSEEEKQEKDTERIKLIQTPVERPSSCW